MLTISQLADYVGVTVRAVRHYHQRGLFPEPERDASGYRRYDAQAVIELIRIKTLTDAGVPLARVQELLAATPDSFATAVKDIDRALGERIRELREHRKRIAELTGGERLFLPEQIVRFLDELRELGVSERTVEVERDGWIMLTARYPELVVPLIEDKRAHLADPDYRRLYVGYDQARDWHPDDPRLRALAEDLVSYGEREQAAGFADDDADTPKGTDAMLVSGLSSASPGWIRLGELALEIARARGHASTPVLADAGM
jgi:DNA-binding transcriptional MerR regulator